jgi:hypothetical protein
MFMLERREKAVTIIDYGRHVFSEEGSRRWVLHIMTPNSKVLISFAQIQHALLDIRDATQSTI